MADNRIGCNSGLHPTRCDYCIDTDRIMDSCRDRDCYENIRVILTDFGNEIINRTLNVRAKDAKIASTNIMIEPVRFNKGFYTVNTRFYVKMTFEGCACTNKPVEFDGIAVIEKNVVLFGGESNTTVFTSKMSENDFCNNVCNVEQSDKLPTAAIEVVDPIILASSVCERKCAPKCCCCCSASDIPERVLAFLGNSPADDDRTERFLTVSLGLFSVIRLLRPAQLLINGTEYTVPDKECIGQPEDNPCSVFRSMSFPVNEFNAPAAPKYLPIGPCDKR